MIFNHPYYLNGIDWIAEALNRQCRLTSSKSNNFLISLKLVGRVENVEALRLLELMRPLSPLLNSNLSRHLLHLAPYRKIKQTAVKLPEFSYAVDVGEKSFIEHCTAFANQPFASANEHLAVRVIAGDDYSLVMFKFDHRLFDGRGGELLIAKLNNAWQTDEAVAWQEPEALSPQLNDWHRQFASGRQVNRWLQGIKERGRPYTFSPKSVGMMANNCFKQLSFSAVETAEIFQHAEQQLGPYMNTPYLVAMTSIALSSLSQQRGASVDDYLLLPMTVDLRNNGGTPDELFFNQWSMMPFIVPLEKTTQKAALLHDLKQQFIEFLRNGFMQAICNANLLTRIMPLPFFARMSSGIFGGTAGSCSYAFIADSAYSADRFMGKAVVTLWHLPSMPPNPGIGIFMTCYQGQLTVMLSYRDGVIRNSEAKEIIIRLKTLL